MIKLNRWSSSPPGQVLLATLVFCFIFLALFIGVYKSGLLYNAKERACRSTEMTALSMGAVYANGIQLVRLSNAILLGFALVDLAVILGVTHISGGLALPVIEAVDPHTRNFVQIVQKVLFGVSLPTGAYPFLIFSEGLSSASNNQLRDNWPDPAKLSWSVPLPPSPVFLFNLQGPYPMEAFLPNMALKFRTLDLFLFKLPEKSTKAIYFLKDKRTGKTHYFEQHEVEIAPNSKNIGQLRVKSGEFENKYVGVLRETEEETAKEAQKRAEKAAGKKLKSLFTYGKALKQIKMDVTDRDDIPNHTVIVYSSFPAKVQGPQGSQSEVQSISEVSVEGPGMAAWDLFAPPYQCKLMPKDPAEIARLMKVQGMVQTWASQGKLPGLKDMFSMILGDHNHENP